MSTNLLHAAGEPTSLRICGVSDEFAVLEAEAGDGKPKLKRFSIVGYNGGYMTPEGWGYPVVVDLDGMSVPRQSVPALMSHNHSSIVGHTDSIEKTQQRLKLTGVFSAYSDTEQSPGAQAARDIVRLAANGYPWQASIGASVQGRRFVPESENVKVNGRNFSGPFVLIEKSTLAEISFVAVGADMNTSANVAATAANDLLKGSNMNPEFVTWLKANDYTEQEIGGLAGKKLTMAQAAWEASKSPPVKPKTTFEESIAAVEAENERIEHIQRLTVEACERHVGDSIRCKQFKDLCASALEDKTVAKKDFELQLLRLGRGHFQIQGSRPQQTMTNEVVEAALCLSQKLPGVEKHFDERTLEAASTGRFKKGIGLGEVLVIAAEHNGNYRGSPRDVKPLLQAAYGNRFEAAGPSQIDISGILSGVANKFLRPAFESVEMEWKKIVIIKPVTDFKEIKSYSLVGDNVYEELGPGGKIKDGSLGQTAYANRAKSFGKLLGLSYQDIRNDDLGALTGISKKLGRGGALKMNEVIWSEWRNDAAFFPTDKSLGNYDDGATDSVLSLAGLTNADTLFRAQTNPKAPGDTETTPLGAIPKILLVPIPLRTTGWNLMNSQFILGTGQTAAPSQGTANPWQGQFMLVASSYLGAGNTNGSDTAWWLLADPQDICGLEVVVLDGQEMPIIEFGDPDFDELGIKARGTHHFGAAKQEAKCGVKMKGAA